VTCRVTGFSLFVTGKPLLVTRNPDFVTPKRRFVTFGLLIYGPAMACRLSTLSILVSSGIVAGAAVADQAQLIGTVSVTDGDTLAMGPVRIRLHGIDAPEAGQTCKRANGRSWQCGTEATSRLAELVEGRKVECTALDRDAYGRIIAICAADGFDVNATLVDEGFAWAFTRYSDQYAQREAAAKAAGIGIWQGEAQAPWEYRADRWNRAAAASPREGCPIKGNISKDERIYHTPWSPHYERTRIDEGEGERWFCDEAEAQAAGWRPARWR